MTNPAQAIDDLVDEFDVIWPIGRGLFVDATIHVYGTWRPGNAATRSSPGEGRWLRVRKLEMNGGDVTCLLDVEAFSKRFYDRMLDR